ncbi:MAG TPA: sugar ABC transporter ATP-binding protein [Tepidisphaeraceae bacterium]|nr:sugar ABC transporter ATP-binding protein [Tepidisphaeraceae bacterium]
MTAPPSQPAPQPPTPPAESDIVIEARGISKSFPGVRALQEVNLVLRRGRLTALLGENGAGKSTLMNILAGVFAPDAGVIQLDGQPVRFANPRDAQAAGIAMIFQELNLIPHLSVAENIFLGREPLNRLGLIDYPAMNRAAAALLARLELPVAPTAVVAALRVGQQQVVEIAKALAGDARVIIMDEPTSALTEHEIDALFSVIASLKQRGVAVAYITHKLHELTRIGDDAAVMRDGRLVATAPLTDLRHDEIVRLMVGRELKDLYQRSPASPGEEVLRVEGLSLRHPTRPGDFVLRDVGLRVRRGEVLGIFGLMGAGRTELLETLFGLHARGGTGQVFVAGERALITSPSAAIAHGLALAPEDRKREGLVLGMSVAENASLASLRRVTRAGFIDGAAEAALAHRATERFRVKTPSLRQAVRNLSGGNQQKVILGKWISTEPKVLLLDEPTRGIDVNAKREIYVLIDELKRAGLAVVVVSSELPEILAISDRIMVLSEGRKTAEFDRASATEEQIMLAALPRTNGNANFQTLGTVG